MCYDWEDKSQLVPGARVIGEKKGYPKRVSAISYTWKFNLWLDYTTYTIVLSRRDYDYTLGGLGQDCPRKQVYPFGLIKSETIKHTQRITYNKRNRQIQIKCQTQEI